MTTELRCGACGESNPERARFCLACGTPLAAASPRAHASRRTVTVVFADMVGFTALGERLDVESLRRVMDGFYAEMRRAIEGESGTLAKFIGDAVLAVWGTPEVREDDAVRAVRAAEAMRCSLAGLNERLEARWGVRVGMRTGVNTGEVVVDPARPADLLVGDTLNVAARLEQAAADGEVLIGPHTQQLVRDHAVLEAVEPLRLKGKSEPMPAWRLVDGMRSDSRAAPRIEAPLVGRDGELRTLRERFDEAVATRACRLVSVIGSPGLGKTRLAAELARSVRGEAVVLQGRCEATGEGITFGPVAEVIRAAAGIEEDDAPDVARAKIEAALPDDEPDRQRIADRAAALLGLAPASSTEETFWAVRRLLEGIARERAVLLVYEDIHWGEPTFLDLVEYLATWVGDVPLLIVALARPELREVRPGLAEAGGAVAEMIALEPLAADESRTLVERLLGDAELPPALAERVLETTDGNPLFVGEMLRMLADEGVLRRDGDTWVATGDAALVTVPPTIQALLAARIERLDADERSVVERASVIGHQFYRAAVAELTPAETQPTVDGALVTLQRKELVRREDALWLDERVFRFHHVLIRDAAYRSLLKEARADLHERFADWLERKAGEVAGELEEMIAFHLEQAHLYRLELGPLDNRGRSLGMRAAARLHSAGQRALAREDLPAATNLLRRALAPLPRDERVVVLVDLAEALLSAGDTVAAEEVVEELGLGADEAGDERLGAWATVFSGQLDSLTGAGRVRETVEAASEAAEILARASDGSGEAKAHQVVAQAEALLGQVAAAEAALDRALVAARAANDRRRVTAVLSGAPRAALWGPAPIVRASGRCLDIVRILRMTPGTRHVEAAALRCQAVLEAMRGRCDSASAILDGCRATFEELGLALELHETALHAGIVALLGGDSAAAENELRVAQEGFLALRVDSGAAQAAALLARALLEQGRDDEALEATHFAEERGGEDLKTTIAWLGVRAEALARGGALEEALALAERAVQMAEPTDALADKADALMALARVRAAVRGGDPARATADQARALYAEKGHSVGVLRAAAFAGGDPAVAQEVDEDEPVPLDGAARPRERALDETAVGRLHFEYVRANNDRDWDAFRGLLHDDYRHVEHRAAATWGTGGADELTATMKAWAEMAPDARLETAAIYAQNEHLVAGQLVGRGTSDGVEFEVPYGFLGEVRDGLGVLTESYEPEDRDLLMRRFEERACERELEETPVGRLYLAHMRASNERDWQTLRALFHDDCLFKAHVRLGAWDLRDADDLVATLQGFAEMSPDSSSALRTEARAEHVLAAVVTGRGTAGDADWELAIGFVCEERDGRFARMEGFEPDDREGMARRFEQVARERELETTPVGRANLAALRSFNERDWDALRNAIHEDYTIVDHRQMAGWDAETRDEYMTIMKTWSDMTTDGQLLNVRIYGHTEHVLAAVLAGSGSVDGVEFELPLGSVVEERDGVVWRQEMFDPADEDAIMRRFEEAVRYRELERTETGRLHLEFLRAFTERDWEAVRSLYSDEHVVVDHRPVAVWDAGGDVEQYIAGMKAWGELSADSRMVNLRVDAQVEDLLAGVAAGSGTVDGAEFELGFGFVIEGRDGRVVRTDLFDPDDVEGILACFERMQSGAASQTPATRAIQRYLDTMCRRDWDGLRESFTPDFRLVDTRGLGWEEQDRDAMLATALSVGDGGRFDASVRWLAASSDAAAYVVTWSGISDEGGGRWEVPLGVVNVVDGAVAYGELFEPDDEEPLLARFAELTADAARHVHPLVRVGAERLGRLFNERRWDEIRAAVAGDFEGRDLRLISGREFRGPEGLVALWKGIEEMGPGARMSTVLLAGELLPGGYLTSAGITTHRAPFEDGGDSGLRFEVRTGTVRVSREGLLWRTDILDDDPEAVLAHYDAVKAATQPD